MSNRMSRRFYRADSMVFPQGFYDQGATAEQENKWVFEVSWEVVNKGEFPFWSKVIPF